MSANWFQNITGFREGNYEHTRSQLTVEGDELISKVDGSRHGIGELSLPTLAELRDRVNVPTTKPITVRPVVGDARAMHADPELEGALFQVASQFNVLEMTGPRITPEHGVTRYADDPTQGPACAIAAGAATIYRNYFAPVGDQTGQTRDRQLDALAEVGRALSAKLGLPVDELWSMQNGYALCTPRGLAVIADVLSDDAERDEVRRQLAIGLHRRVQVTDVRQETRRFVSQAFCSALPVSYGGGLPSNWEAFGRLVLEATYEATLLAAVENSQRGDSNVVLLTRVGGGAFGNPGEWIHDAIVQALTIVEGSGLDVRLVAYSRIGDSSRAIAERFNG